MDLQEKLTLLGQAARFDDSVSQVKPASPGRETGQAGSPEPADEFGLFAIPQSCEQTGPDVFPYVSRVVTPGGCRMPVLKVLQTSACQNDCLYCAFRAGRDVRRMRFTPDELARAFDLMQRAGVVQGMFLSSGVANAPHAMDEILATAELVRTKYQFRGYVHLKILPGAEEAQIARAVELADRVSVNLEAPTPARLACLAPQKQMSQLASLLRVAAAVIRKQSPGVMAGSRNVERHVRPTSAMGHARLGISTQFVVGPAGESDRELLTTTQQLYREVRLARAYYSAFNPVPGTPLEGVQPTDPRREFRLYQADWLLRYYDFSVQELSFGPDGGLDQGVDPKMAWAKAHPERFPVEVNRASLPELLRIPGVGPASARAILAERRRGTLRELGDLRRLGAVANRAAPYVLLAGKRPPYQPALL